MLNIHHYTHQNERTATTTTKVVNGKHDTMELGIHNKKLEEGDKIFFTTAKCGHAHTQPQSKLFENRFTRTTPRLQSCALYFLRSVFSVDLQSCIFKTFRRRWSEAFAPTTALATTIPVLILHLPDTKSQAICTRYSSAPSGSPLTSRTSAVSFFS